MCAQLEIINMCAQLEIINMCAQLEVIFIVFRVVLGFCVVNIHPVSYVLNFASVSGLSILDCPFGSLVTFFSPSNFRNIITTLVIITL
jgi:hypothetical protein